MVTQLFPVSRYAVAAVFAIYTGRAAAFIKKLINEDTCETPKTN